VSDPSSLFNEEQRRRLHEWSLRRISKERLLEAFPDDFKRDPESIEGHLHAAIEAKSAKYLSDSFRLAGIFCYQPSTAFLTDLLPEDWHSLHEDIMIELESRRDPSTTAAIAAVAERTFSWDFNFAFNRKCTWALYRIGTEEAFEVLERLADSDNEAIRGFAMKRLIQAGRRKSDSDETP